MKNSINVDHIINVRYFDKSWFQEDEEKCSAEMIETFRNVQSRFASNWIIIYSVKTEPGIVECPGTKLIFVDDSGKVDENMLQ
ncbi:hypothetical protein PM8797T_28099 [Gimesia maris DSM 8797]|uniref:Uncharacterized protein n=1 Tax=Gimesia maris TaxID=122 RepID=A0ABX5YNS1_9PLAN|nr:hypothetical protein PM8797T_28099 [Gimesia maris DSM 8797]QEG17331.1 hypothetical protein GmarT_32110 [Gimesia maris]